MPFEIILGLYRQNREIVRCAKGHQSSSACYAMIRWSPRLWWMSIYLSLWASSSELNCFWVSQHCFLRIVLNVLRLFVAGLVFRQSASSRDPTAQTVPCSIVCHSLSAPIMCHAYIHNTYIHELVHDKALAPLRQSRYMHLVLEGLYVKHLKDAAVNVKIQIIVLCKDDLSVPRQSLRGLIRSARRASPFLLPPLDEAWLRSWMIWQTWWQAGLRWWWPVPNQGTAHSLSHLHKNRQLSK